MKKTKLLLIIIISLLLITGCGKTNSNTSDYSGKGELNCTREGELDGGEVAFTYILNYKNGNIITLRSIEQVISDDKELLDQYEEAYKNIFKAYEKLKYYDNSVIRDKTSVTSDTLINYDKIDIDSLLAIEGEEDNIIEDGKAKVEKWMSLAKKFGTTCE